MAGEQLRDLDRARGEGTEPRVPAAFSVNPYFWCKLADIYQLEGWEKAEEWLERGRGG